MAELVLEFDNPDRALSANEIDRMGWQQRRRYLAGWRESTTAELRHAALRRPLEWGAVAGHPSYVQLDIGVTVLNKTRDPHNYARLAKGIIDELKLQPAYAPGIANQRRKRLRDRHTNAPLWINQGWALWPDDTAEFVELRDATFHRGPTTRIIITTKETDGVQEHAASS